MATLTIPKNLLREEDLVVIPKSEYKSLLQIRTKKIEEVKMTSITKKALMSARKNLSKNKFLNIGELRHKLGIAH